MEQAAIDLGKDVVIWAVSADEVSTNLDKADVLLLGPQVRYKYALFKKEADAKGVPIDIIPAADYGRMNGANILQLALKMKKEE